MQLKIATLVLLGSGIAAAQYVPLPFTPPQFFDNSGLVLAGGCLYTYQAGGTTPQTTYVSESGSANPNPVVLNSAGRSVGGGVWLTPGLSYRFDLYADSSGCSTGNPLIWSVDNVVAPSLAGTSTVTANYIYAGPTSGAAALPTFRAAVFADLPAITATPCTNQVITAISTSIVGTCTTLTGAFFGSSIAARSILGRNAATAGAPTFNTTQDALAYQVAEIPAFVSVASDFTTSGSGTALETITGLTWTIPANTALNVPFACYFVYSQAVANDVVAFGFQDVTVSPTNVAGTGVIFTNTTAVKEGTLASLSSTTAMAIVSATPAATGTNFVAQVQGFIEAPSNASSSAIRIMVSTATAADLVTVRRGSWCRLN